MKKLLVTTLLLAATAWASAQSAAPAPLPKNPAVAAEKQEIANDKATRMQIKSARHADRANIKAAKASGNPQAVAAEQAKLQQDRAATQAKAAELRGDRSRKKMDHTGAVAAPAAN